MFRLLAEVLIVIIVSAENDWIIVMLCEGPSSITGILLLSIHSYTVVLLVGFVVDRLIGYLNLSLYACLHFNIVSLFT